MWQFGKFNYLYNFVKTSTNVYLTNFMMKPWPVRGSQVINQQKLPLNFTNLWKSVAKNAFNWMLSKQNVNSWIKQKQRYTRKTRIWLSNDGKNAGETWYAQLNASTIRLKGSCRWQYSPLSKLNVRREMHVICEMGIINYLQFHEFHPGNKLSRD